MSRAVLRRPGVPVSPAAVGLSFQVRGDRMIGKIGGFSYGVGRQAPVSAGLRCGEGGRRREVRSRWWGLS